MKTELRKAKDKAWGAYSIFIRTRDCLRFTGDPERGMCITCKKPYHFKQLQAGHFIAGRTNSVLFDEEATYSQCYACNVGRGGAHVEYFVFMEQEHSRKKIDELRYKKGTTVKYRADDYKAIESLYKQKTEDLLDNIKRS